MLDAQNHPIQFFFQRLNAKPFVFFELVFASLLISLLGLASPLFFIQVLNRYVSYGVDSTLTTLCVGVFFAIVFEYCFSRMRLSFASAVCAKPDRLAAEGSFETFLHSKFLPLSNTSVSRRYEFMQASDTISSAFSPNNLTTILDLPFALLFIFVIALIHPFLALIAFAGLCLTFLCGLFSGMSMRKLTHDYNHYYASKSNVKYSAVEAMDTAHIFNGLAFLQKRWNELEHGFLVLQKKIDSHKNAVSSLIKGFTLLMSVSMISVAAILAVKGQISTGAMIGANMLAVRALMPFIKLSHMVEQITQAQRAFSLLGHLENTPQEKSQGVALRDFKGHVELSDLAFFYPPSGPGTIDVLYESLDCKVAAGDILVVFGENGAGKSTLGKLLVGLIEPVRGQVLVDGVAISNLDPSWWHQQIVYLPQEPTFLNASVRENIMIGNPDADEELFVSVTRQLGLNAYFDQRTDGFDVAVVQNGMNFSLGIRRRIALARALITGDKGKVMIVDEPFEGIDEHGQKAIQEMMDQFNKAGKTIIIMTNNLKSVKRYDVLIDVNCKPIPKVEFVSGKKRGN